MIRQTRAREIPQGLQGAPMETRLSSRAKERCACLNKMLSSGALTISHSTSSKAVLDMKVGFVFHHGMVLMTAQPWRSRCFTGLVAGAKIVCTGEKTNP